ncbi:MAG: hypothetical protein WCD18_03575 [Thermosynechococcaceae cyanobacterium]
MNRRLQVVLFGGVFCTLAAFICPTKVLAETPSRVAVPSVDVNPPGRNNLIGINVDFVGDYSYARPFADAIKQSRDWLKLDSNLPATRDSHGWPLEDTRITVWHGIARMNGTYRLSFTGQADVTIQCCSGSLANLTYDASSNTTTGDLLYPSVENEGLFLMFKNTKRSPTSSLNSGIASVKLMRPISEGSTQSYSPETVFTDSYKAVLKRFRVLRFMDFLATNSNNQVRWSERLTPAWYSMFQQASEYGWQGRGAAYEYAIQLCNEVEADCWLTIPAKANDQYVQNLARLIKRKLNPRRKLYIEYSNEVWNTAGGFQQSAHNYQLAKAEVASGKSPLNFDGDNNEWYWAWRRVAKRGTEISLIFRRVFGDTAMMKRVRPVLMTQLGYGDGPLLQAIHLMQDYYNNPNQVPDPKPLKYYFYGLGGSAYYAPKTPTSPTAAFADFTNRETWIPALQKDIDYATAFGVKRIAYEGGPSLENGSINDTTRALYRDDPRIVPEMIEAHNQWSAIGGDLLVYFTLTGESPWGFVPDIWDATNSQKNLKLQAIDKLNTSRRAKVTYGVLIPATLPATSYNAPPGWLGNLQMNQLKPGQWASYTTRVAQPQTFYLQLQASAVEANTAVDLLVDGDLMGTLDIPQSTSSSRSKTSRVKTSRVSTSSTLAIPLRAGLRGIMIRGKTGVANIQQVVISSSPARHIENKKQPLRRINSNKDLSNKK